MDQKKKKEIEHIELGHCYFRGGLCVTGQDKSARGYGQSQ